MTTSTQWSESRCAQYEFSIDIEASRERVWLALTDQLNAWWLPDFHMLGTDSVVTLELHAGGRLYEQNGDQHLLWYNVLALQKNESLDLAGYISAKFGGPATTLLNVTLSTLSAKRTTLRLADSLIGRVSDESVNSLNSGWQMLFSSGLKAFVES